MKKFLYRIFETVFIFIFIFQSTCICAETGETAASTANPAEISYTVGGKSEGLRGYFPSGLRMTEKTLQGKQVYTLEAKGTDDKKTMYFSVDDQKVNREVLNGNGVEITVEYLDSGSGILTLVYDEVFDEIEDGSYEGVKRWEDPIQGKYGGFVDLEDSKLWKTHTFYIRDPKFLKRLPNNSDFYFSINNPYSGNSSDDVSIASVSVKLMDTKSPARVFSTTGEVGNIFYSNEEVKFNTDIISTVNYNFSGEVVFSALNINDAATRFDKTIEPMRLERDGTLDKKYILSQKRETLTLNAGETINRTVTFDDLNWFGCMTYRVELIDDKNGIYTVYDKSFSRVPRAKGEPLNQNLGMSMHYFGDASENSAYARNGFELLDRCGISWIRGNVMWYYTEPKKGQYKIYKGTENFFKINKEEYGGRFHMYPIMDGGNHNLGSNGEFEYKNFSDKNATDAFGEFVKAYADLTKEYNIDTFEIINEPNLNVLTPKMYAGLLKSVNEKLKPYYPKAKVAGPAVAEVPVDADIEYIPQLFKFGGLDDLDIVSVHPYNWRFSPEFNGNIERLKKLKQLCEQYGKPNIEIWATETGFPTASNNPNIRVPGNDTGVLGQAEWMVRTFIMNYAEKTMDKMFIYTMHDGVDRSNSEARFGITVGGENQYEPYAAKPALVAVSNASRLLDNAELKEKIEVGNREELAYLFKREGKEDIIALWSTKEKAQLALDLGVSEITVCDMYGNESKRYSENGVYEFVLDGQQTYLTGKFKNFKKVDSGLSYDTGLVYNAVPDDTYDFEISNNSGLSLTAKTEGIGNISVVKPVEFDEAGKGKGSFMLNKGNNSEIVVKLYNGDKLYTEVSFVVKPTDRLTIEVEKCEPYNSSSLNRWAVTLLITNNGVASEVSGYIKLQSPESVAANLSAIQVGAIPPGKQRRVTFYLPEMNKKYKENLAGIFYMSDGNEQYISFGVDFTLALYTDKPPVIDGKIEENEWTRGAWLYLDKATQIRQLEDWKGPEDLSGRVNIMWDNENLYLASVVQDDIFGETEERPGMVWANDSLQIALKCDMTTEMYAFNELTISKLKGETIIYRNKSEGTATLGLVTNFKGKTVRDEMKKTTTYEVAIPWTELTTSDFKINPGISIAFSMLINDNDGKGRRGWIELTPGIGYEKDPSLFTNIKLIK